MDSPVYLREEDDYVGPFASREDAERFLILMEAHGVTREGIEIVVAEGLVEHPTSAKEREELLLRPSPSRKHDPSRSSTAD